MDKKVSNEIMEKYNKNIEDYISDYNTEHLEEAYGDGYDEVSKVFKKAMMDVFYYGFSLGLEEKQSK